MTELTNLTAGPVTALLDPATGALRDIRVHGVEAIRGVYAAVRDRDWGTVSPRIERLRIDQNTDTFAVDFLARCRRRPIAFDWHGQIVGESDGSIRYAFDGKAVEGFERNRIGFCVLHPRECAGRACVVTHDDGCSVDAAFPDVIAPHQPFLRLRALEHDVSPGVRCRVDLEGDVFEMEDQRNWTDASFKTYCTPLALPFPVAVRPGDRVRQSVSLTFAGGPHGAPAATASPGVTTCRIGSERRRIPPLGVEATPGHTHSRDEVAQLKRVGPAHVRVEVRPGDAHWRDDAGAGVALANELGCPVELAVFIGEPVERGVAAVCRWLERTDFRCARILLLSPTDKVTPPHLIRAGASALRHAGGGATVIGGTDAFFAELNRDRPDMADLDGVVYSINPQVHAADDLSMAETLSAQADTVRSAAAIAQGKPVVVSPVTLRLRWNPNAISIAVPADSFGLPAHADVRQLSGFGAAWTLGCIKHLVESGASSITIFRSVGFDGLMQPDEDNPLPQLWPATPGQVYPLANVLTELNAWTGAESIGSVTDPPGAVESFVIERDGARTVYLANLSCEPQAVRLDPGLRVGLEPHAVTRTDLRTMQIETL